MLFESGLAHGPCFAYTLVAYGREPDFILISLVLVHLFGAADVARLWIAHDEAVQ